MPIGKLEKELEEVPLAKADMQKPVTVEKRLPDELYAKLVKFTNIARMQYGEIVKSVLIFGSAVRGDAKKTSDADVWVVLDDTATKSGEDLEKIQSHLHLVAHELKDLHVQVTPLTEFWQWVRLGSPELVNFLRYGLSIYDSGFIKPIQRMLNAGMISPSDEAISLRAKASEARYRRLKLDMKAMVFDLRYCASDIIQAVVMHHYKAQPDQKGISEYLERFVKEKKLEKIWIEKWNEMNKMWKDIDHKIVKEVDAAYLDKAMKLAKEIIDRFKKLIPKEILGEELPEEE